MGRVQGGRKGERGGRKKQAERKREKRWGWKCEKKGRRNSFM